MFIILINVLRNYTIKWFKQNLLKKLLNILFNNKKIPTEQKILYIYIPLPFATLQICLTISK